MHISPPLNQAQLQLTGQTPPQNDKLEFPAQVQTSQIQPNLKVFLFPKAQVGPFSTWELLTVFSLLPVLVSGCSPWDSIPTPCQLQPCQDVVLSSLLSWLQGVPRCTQTASHRIQNIPNWSNLGSISHRPSAAWEDCSSTSLLEEPTPCTPAVCSKLWLVVTARDYSPYLYYLQKVGSSIEELLHGYINKNVLMSYFPAASAHSVFVSHQGPKYSMCRQVFAAKFYHLDLKSSLLILCNSPV